MSLYRVSKDKLEPVEKTSFAAESLLERKDIQRLLQADISPLGDDLLVLASEYGDWEDSNRRIDLLCLARDAGLVVVEIKRTEDGGHMELQAIRYAAMVSSLTLEQAIGAYAQTKGIDETQATAEVVEFLQWESDEDGALSGEVRIILVSANFSTELTTSVLWLNRHDLDITCLRLLPYRIGADVFIDATQIIPLPEATEYEVKIRAKEKEKRKAVGLRQEILRKFWLQFVERSKTRTSLFANRTPSTDHWLTAGIGRHGFALNVSLAQEESRVECYMRLPGDAKKSKAAFEALLSRRAEIESRFGGPLQWEDLPGRVGCRISRHLPGGWKTPESEWPEFQDRLIDGLIGIEDALKQSIQQLAI